MMINKKHDVTLTLALRIKVMVKPPIGILCRYKPLDAAGCWTDLKQILRQEL